MKPAITTAYQSKFASYVDRSDESGCWIWTGPQDNYGFGRFRFGPRGNQRQIGAHRAAIFFSVGRVFKHVQQSCLNRLCCNPSHLAGSNGGRSSRWFQSTIADVMANMEKTDTCWIWKGRIQSGGYGIVRFEGRDQYAHRVVFEIESGKIPEGLQIDHLCRNRRCVNPSHLEPVTQKENILRGTGVSARNAAKTHCVRGHEYTIENSYLRPDGGGKQCRICIKARTESKKRKLLLEQVAESSS